MTKLKILLSLTFFVSAGLCIKAYSLYQAISPNAITYWQVSDESNHQKIDHELWQLFLSKYLHENSSLNTRTFNYENVTNKDKQVLNDYLSQLQSIDPRIYSKNVQLAYWINLYNALTIQIVLAHYPIESIKDIGDGFTGPWNIELANITGRTITLNKIEHGILRALWQDNRIHYVINCASIGCPDLPKQAFSNNNIEQQLNNAAIRFINQNKGVKLIDGILRLSSIYSWFSSDFGQNNAGTIEHIKQFASPELKAQLDDFSGEIEFSYDWQLNSTL